MRTDSSAHVAGKTKIRGPISLTVQGADVKGIEDLLMMPCGILDCARDWCLRLDGPQQRSALVRTVVEGWILAEGVAKDADDIIADILNEEVEASKLPL